MHVIDLTYPIDVPEGWVGVSSLVLLSVVWVHTSAEVREAAGCGGGGGIVVVVLNHQS